MSEWYLVRGCCLRYFHLGRALCHPAHQCEISAAAVLNAGSKRSLFLLTGTDAKGATVLQDLQTRF